MRSNIFKIRSKLDSFILNSVQSHKKRSIQRVLIMTSDAFNSFNNDLERYLAVDLLIVDEGHKAKNVDTVLRKAIKSFNAR